MESTVPNELSARIKFTDVVKRFEKIAATKDNKTKAVIVDKFFKTIFDLQKKFRLNEGPNADASFYPFLRLFVPHKDNERGSYGIQIHTLGRLFVQALAVNPKSTVGMKLTNLKGVQADYGDIVYEVMKNRSPTDGELTVYEVNKYLDLIADHFEQNERKKIDTEIVTMFQGMSATDRKWLTRILLKKLNLGIGDKRILDIYHPSAFDLYAQCSHLSDVCKAIESNNIPVAGTSNGGASNGLSSNGLIQLFRPLRPMLCERGYISQIQNMLAKNDYYLETKMDGERCQVHVDGTQFKYFSRGCKDDLTHVFGSSNSNGLFSPFFHRQLNAEVKNAIFDGEMMVWDNVEDSFLKKSENFTAKYLKQDDQQCRPCYVIYDLIYLNGESLTKIPYAERIRKLKTLFREQKGALVCCERTKLRDADHFLECLNKAFDANEEGVVIKEQDSKYHPGKREHGGWFKMKPDYENGLISDFDLAIVGGYYNDNRTYIDSFLLAVLKKGEHDDDLGVFHAVCKIRNGLSRSQFREITQKLAPYQHIFAVSKNRGAPANNSPPGIEWANANPDFWYDPQHSVVVQIKASELVETTKYRTSHSFRFPRVMAIRWDKATRDTCTLNEFQTFCSSNSKVERLTKRHATADDLNKTPFPKRKRTGPAPSNAASSSALVEIEPVDNVCKGLDFCVVVKSGPSADELKNMIRRHGGNIVLTEGPKTFVVIADNPQMLKVSMIIKGNKHNIAKPEWVKRALGSDESLTALAKFTPDDMLFATESLKNQFDSEQYGDENDTEPMVLNENGD